MRNFLYAILILTLSAQCHAPKNAAQSKGLTTLSAIAKNPAKFEGKEVIIEGNFLGWKYADCKFPESFNSIQLTRSDWVIQDAKWCCIVTGSLPDKLDPASSNPLPIQLTALVKLKNSRVYLELANIVVK